jgi:hypothetical protein
MAPRYVVPVAVLLVAMLAGACGSSAASPVPASPTALVEPPATGGPASLVPAITPTPATATATPPATAAPPTPAPTPAATSSSTPAPLAADIIVRLDVCADVCVDPRREEYLADGRVIHLDLDTHDLLERRLSPAGLARVRFRVAADADLLARDLRVEPVPVAGREPPGHGATGYTFIAPAATGGRATVRTLTADSLDEGYWQPDPRIDRLTALGDALLDPDALAGADGWADPAWSPYAPAKTAVFVHVRDGIAPFSSPDVGATGWPFGADPRTFGAAFASTMDAWPIARCALMDTAAADAAAAALPSGSLGEAGRRALLRDGTMAWADRGLELEVLLRPLLPDQEAMACGDLWPLGG